MTAKKFLLQKAKKAVPALLRGHKGDVISILSSIEGTSPEAYTGALSLVKLTKDFIDLMTDEAFTELFISAQSTEKPSGSAQENTKAPVA